MPHVFLKVAAATAALCLVSAPVAHAATDTSSGSGWRVTATTSVSDRTPAVGAAMEGKVTVQYTARTLGITMPVTGYIVSSFPYAPFAKPKVTSENCLESAGYTRGYDKYLKKDAWLVTGQRTFWDDTTLKVTARATADSVSAGYFHGGTGTDHWLDANARDYVKSHK